MHKKNSKAEVFLSTLNFNPFASLGTNTGKVCQLQHPAPALFVPVKAAVTPPGQNRSPLGRTVKAKAVDGSQAARTLKPFSKAAKGTESRTILYSSFILKIKYAQHRPRYTASRIDRHWDQLVGTEEAKSAKQKQ